MTPEKEIEIMKWLVDNYPNHETNCVKIWELIKIVNHYHESEVKKLNIPAVINRRELLLSFLQYLDKDKPQSWFTHESIVNAFLSKQ